MKKFVRKLQKDGTHSYTINIPKELVEEFKWKERQKIEIFKYFYAIAYFSVISAGERGRSPSATGKRVFNNQKTSLPIFKYFYAIAYFYLKSG